MVTAKGPLLRSDLGYKQAYTDEQRMSLIPESTRVFIFTPEVHRLSARPENRVALTSGDCILLRMGLV